MLGAVDGAARPSDDRIFLAMLWALLRSGITLAQSGCHRSSVYRNIVFHDTSVLLGLVGCG
jgi:hypothetical protein